MLKILPILAKLTSITVPPAAVKAAIVVGSLLFVLMIYLLVRSSPEKYYAKAARCHKRGERRYLEGNHEGAEAAYMKAEEFRKRARELQ